MGLETSQGEIQSLKICRHGTAVVVWTCMPDRSRQTSIFDFTAELNGKEADGDNGRQGWM